MSTSSGSGGRNSRRARSRCSPRHAAGRERSSYIAEVLAEIRRRRGMTQAQVAARMGVGKSRVSQIEKGRVSTRDVLDRYVEALGGRLSLMADFGDELLRVG